MSLKSLIDHMFIRATNQLSLTLLVHAHAGLTQVSVVGRSSTTLRHAAKPSVIRHLNY